jgi:MtrB/PioB family decaheme-associated outer membrane protein
MNARSDSSKTRRAILLSGTMFFATIPLCAALAQMPPVDPNATPGWDFYGKIEAGVRVLLDGPPSGFGKTTAPFFWLTPQTTESRAKFEEFGEIRSGLWLGILNLGMASKDGRYVVDFWGENIGLNNQYYSLNMAKIGEHYLMLEWDQIPHLISTSAKTIFSGTGTTFLSVADPLQTNLQANSCAATNTGAAPAGCIVPGGPPNTGQHARTNIEGFINDAARSITIGTQRDKASVAYRFTPSDSWDIKINYSHEHRTGTKPMALNWAYGVNANPGFASNIVEFPVPIDDRTQNLSASVQYVGTTPWDTRWVASLKYSGSFYDNALKSVDLENPFCITCTLGAGINRGPNLLRLALAPSNMANAFTFNSMVNLPWKSRWVGTLQYNMMRQNDPFVSTTTNGLVLPDALPAMSANAKVDTFLANNVLTTQLTDQVKSTIRYRYYDVNNNTPELLWGSYIRADSSVVTTDRRNLAIAYTKQNASAELNWRAQRWLTLGAIYAWEQYDRTRRDVNVTNEHSGKLYLDGDVWDYGKLRSSVMYAVRRYRNYDAEHFVEIPGLQFSEVPPQVRKFDIANRNRIKAEAFIDVPVGKMLTATPNFGLRFDDFPTDVLNQLGVKRDNAWNAGIELSAKLNATALLRFAYNYEHHSLALDGTAVSPIIAANIWHSDITQQYHTFIVGADWKAIPGKLDFKFEYLLALGSEANNTIPCSSGNTGCTGGGTGVTTTQFPTERNSYHRLSILARYFVDPEVVQKMGWKGDVVLKTRYLFQRNRNTNWATDTMTPYIPTADQTADLTGGGRSIFLAGINPNYTAHIVTMALAARW